jgi:hypothetical protein
LKDRDVKITSRDLAVFRDVYMASSDLADRMTELIWLDMYALDAVFGVSPHDILRAIRDLEQGEQQSSGAKPATQFRNMPLKGLWHQHYFSAHFLGQNIRLALGKTGPERFANEVLDPTKSAVATKEMVEKLAHRIVHEPVEARAAAQKLTGQWIIYLQHEGKNYYLCCNSHKAGDPFIYDRIMENCVRDFPDLPEWLKAAQT